MVNLLDIDNNHEKNAVFLDTNSVDKDNFTTGVFGKRPALERIAKEYDIKIPRIVFDELQEHKRRKFENEKRQLLGNALTKRIGVDFQAVKQLVFDQINEEIIERETIPYEMCEMEEPEQFLEKFYELAVRHKPPFDAGSDKGFKDACIASTIDRYLNEHDDVDYIVLVTADERLKDYFADNQRVKTYGKVEDLLEKRIQAVETAKTEAKSADVEARSARSEDIENEINDAIMAFCSSGSFMSTHNAVARLAPLSQYLDESEKVRIVRSATSNDQISSILGDEDIKLFVMPLFREVEDWLTNRQYRTFVNAVGLPDNRQDDDGNAVFSTAEQRVYRRLIDNLISHISTRGWDSKVNTDDEAILAQIRGLLAQSSLDPNTLSWKTVSNVFIEGSVSVEPGLAPRDALLDFSEMLAACNPQKRASVIQAISNRLKDIEVDYDDLPF